jgi:ATP-dependent DNA helicase PIF1
LVGIAAVHVGGMTVHSFAGTGKGEDGIIELKKKVSYSKRSSKQWTGCKTLVIDEVSMVHL